MIPRENYLLQIKRAFKTVPVVVLIGARQVGKTTLMNGYTYNADKFFLNGQNPEVIELFSDYSTIENYLKIHLNKPLNGYLLIDEFQFIQDISTIMKLLTDNHNHLKIITTGSSSLDIIQQVEESLAGRVRLINVYPLSFPEYIRFQDNELYELYSKYSSHTEGKIISNQIKLMEFDYLTFGGLPRVALTKSKSEKINLLNDIYQTYLLRDVKAYVKNQDSVGFNKMLRLLSSQIGNLLNTNALSRSSGLNYKKTADYLYLLEQMFIIKQIEPYFTNQKNTITKMKKIYFYDTGLRNMIYNSFNDITIRTDNGALFENYVFLELMKNAPPYFVIKFYRTKDGAEINFILDDMTKKKIFEAKFKNLEKPIKVKSLTDFRSKENIKETFLVNQNLNTVQHDIHYLPSCLISKTFRVL